jgi:2'-hydroxyisoflavone reductase
MRLLVLGGTRFVGRAVATDAVARGWDVTVLNRGVSGSLPGGVTTLTADRTSYDGTRAALGDDGWDLVVDTWSGGPSAVRDAAELLAGRTDRYGYVSSRSVYTWPLTPGAGEGARWSPPTLMPGPATTPRTSGAASWPPYARTVRIACCWPAPG